MDAERGERTLELWLFQGRETKPEGEKGDNGDKEAHCTVAEEDQFEIISTRLELKFMIDAAAENTRTMISDRIVEAMESCDAGVASSPIEATASFFVETIIDEQLS